MISEALIFFAIAAALVSVLMMRLRTGSLLRISGKSAAQSTRAKRPMLFWLWNFELIGASIFAGAAGLICLTDTVGLTSVLEGMPQ